MDQIDDCRVGDRAGHDHLGITGQKLQGQGRLGKHRGHLLLAVSWLVGAHQQFRQRGLSCRVLCISTFLMRGSAARSLGDCGQDWRCFSGFKLICEVLMEQILRLQIPYPSSKW